MIWGRAKWAGVRAPRKVRVLSVPYVFDHFKIYWSVYVLWAMFITAIVGLSGCTPRHAPDDMSIFGRPEVLREIRR